MKRWKRALAIPVSICLCFLFTGCWDYHEIENYTIATSIAIDRNTYGGYHVTMEFLDLSSAQGGAQTAKSSTVSTDGQSVFDAIRNVLQRAGKQMYFANTQEVIVSHQIARSGLKQVMDFLYRDAVPRITLRIVISEENTAAELLDTKIVDGQTPAMQLATILDENESQDGYIIPMRLYQICNVFESPCGESLVLPGFCVETDPNGKHVVVGDSAVFKGDKMVGWLPKQNVKYLAFAKNMITNALLSTGVPHGETQMTLEILSNSANLSTSVQNGAPKGSVKLKTEAALAEISDTSLAPSTFQFANVGKKGSVTLENGIRSTITFSQEMGCDIFGFGLALYQKHPQEWKKYAQDWNSSFQSMTFDVTAEIKIRNSADALPTGSVR